MSMTPEQIAMRDHLDDTLEGAQTEMVTLGQSLGNPRENYLKDAAQELQDIRNIINGYT